MSKAINEWQNAEKKFQIATQCMENLYKLGYTGKLARKLVTELQLEANELEEKISFEEMNEFFKK